MKRGEVYWADLAPRSGEQQGRRPVIVVSHDAFTEVEGWRSVIVVPVSTSPSQMRRGPTAIPLPAGTAGLERDSVALCHLVTSLDRAKLAAQLGTLPPGALVRIGLGLEHAQDLP